MHQPCAEGNQGQDFHREDDFFHEAGVAAHRRGRAGYGFGKDIEYDQAAIQDQPERQPLLLLGPARLKDMTEDKGENTQHQQRAEKNPQHAEHRPPVAQQHIPLDELTKQVAVAPDFGKNAQGIENHCTHRIDFPAPDNPVNHTTALRRSFGFCLRSRVTVA